MNTPHAWQDEHIHALVDGELDAEMARLLEADSRTDATLAARIARQRELRRRLQARFDPVLDEAVPARLSSTVGVVPTLDVVVPIGTARSARTEPNAARRARWGLREWGAMAASLFLGVLVSLVFLRGGNELPVVADGGQLLARGALDAALTRQVSGSSEADAPVQVVLSFRASDGGHCRAFVLRSGARSAGLACRRAGHWQVEVLEGTAPAPGVDAYRQATSSLPATLRAALEARGAGEPLDPAEESGQIARGWDAPRP